MSFVPNEKLVSADSLDLIVYPVHNPGNVALFTTDFWTERRGFWKSLVLRNRQSLDVLQYRRSPNDPLEELAINSEVPIKGWGSYFEVQSAAAAPNWSVDFVAVSYINALRPDLRQKLLETGMV